MPMLKKTNEISVQVNMAHCINESKVLSLHLDRTDKYTQVNLLDLDDYTMLPLKSKLAEMEKGNTELERNIELLQIEIFREKKKFQESLKQNAIELGFYQSKIDELTLKITQLEDIVRFGSSLGNSIQKTTFNDNRIDISGPRILKSKVLQLHRTTEDKPARHMKIKLLADSHGRGLSGMIGRKCNLKISSVIKPGAPTSEIIGCKLFDNESFLKETVTVLIVGSNDVYSNESAVFLRNLESYLISHNYENIIVTTIPTRYDLPRWSIVNEEIRKTNQRIRKLNNFFHNLKVIDIENIGRRLHTSHGLHMNTLGKDYLANRIISLSEEFTSVQSTQTIATLPLLWKNSGND